MIGFRNRLRAAAVALGLAAALPVSQAIDARRVVVARLDSHDVLTELATDEDLTRFQSHWSTRVAQAGGARELSEHGPFSHRIVITGGRDAGIWLYSPRGWVTVLAMRTTRIHRLGDPAAFNALLGIRSP